MTRWLTQLERSAKQIRTVPDRVYSELLHYLTPDDAAYDIGVQWDHQPSVSRVRWNIENEVFVDAASQDYVFPALSLHLARTYSAVNRLLNDFSSISIYGLETQVIKGPLLIAASSMALI